MSMMVNLGDGDDSVDFSSSATAVTVRANGGNDLVVGSAQNDAMNGGVGNDRLDGGNGNDTLDGGVGNDRLSGSEGNDTFVFRKGQITNGNSDLSLTMDHIIDFTGAGENSGAEQDFIRFIGFDAGATFEYVRDANATPNAKIYKVVDGAYSVEILVQFANNFEAGVDILNGGANGTTVANSDFGWL